MKGDWGKEHRENEVSKGEIGHMGTGYMGDQAWWDERFKSRGQVRIPHEPRLEEDIRYFEGKQRILDLACGDGRNAIYLAKLGCEVTAVDFSQEALERLRSFSEQEGLSIQILKADLENPAQQDILSSFPCFDAILINHYRLNPRLYKGLLTHLRSAGILWVNGFYSLPEDNPAVRKADLLRDTDLSGIGDSVETDKRCYSIGNREFVRDLCRKR